MPLKWLAYIIAPVCLLFSHVPARADLPPFVSPASLGSGGCEGASMSGNFFQNPASIALARKWSSYAAYGFSNTGASRSMVEATLPLVPLSFGAMIGYDRIEDDPYGEINTQAAGAAGFGGDIARSMYWGASLVLSSANGAEDLFAAGVKLGFLSSFAIHPSAEGINVHLIDVGFSHLENLSSEEIPGIIERMSSIGVGILFLRSSFLAVRILGDADVGWSSDLRLMKTGFEAEFFNMLFARSGLMYNTGDGSLYFTLGAGIQARLWDWAGRFDYAFAVGEGEKVHYFGASVRFAGTDSMPPRTELSIDYPAFSPNGDGIQDDMVFRIRANDESALSGWVLQITDHSGRLVREFRSRNHSRMRKLLIAPLSIFDRAGSVVLPGRIWWDGTDENGRVLPDGLYFYAFHSWDEHDNISRMQRGKFSIDTVAPTVLLRSAKLLCRPGLNPMEVEVGFARAEGDIASAALVSEKGKPVRRWDFAGKDASARLTWDGIGPDGKPAEAGRYILSFKIEDSAGNRGDLELKNVTVDVREHVVDVAPEEYYCNPAKKKPVKFIAKFPKDERNARWKLHIADSAGKPVRDIVGSGITPFIEWDGRDVRGRACSDGLYLCLLEMSKNDELIAASAEKAFVIDSTPPQAAITVRPKEFTPDGDYYNDEVVIVPEAAERWALEKWEVNIFDENGETIKTFAGKGTLPDSLRWSGRLGDGKIPFSLEKFETQLTVHDKAGNEARSARKSFSTGLLIIPVGRRNHIVFPHYGFRRKGNDDEKLKCFLGLLAEGISRVEPARVELEVHSDFEGDDEANLINTENAAGFAKEFLVRRGIDEKIIVFRGMGETRPLFDEKAGKTRRKNDRIEVFLDLKGE